MIEVTQQKIEELAPNAEAAKKGRELVKKNKFSNLKINAEKNLIWGECAGSGKNPYYCSADYVDPNNPVFRCNCPSRQFPCKHSVGLLYCFEANAGQFTEGEVPEDILSKREKIEKKQEKKAQEKESIKEKAEKPKKVNKAAFTKKVDAQLTGIETSQKLLRDMVNTGLSSVDAKMRATLKTQIKDLGNYYIGGIQTAFNNLLLSIEEVKNEEYTVVVDNLNYLSALLKKATDYLKARKEDPEGTPELSSAIEEQIGYVWKLVELMQYGQYEENASLLYAAARNVFYRKGKNIEILANYEPSMHYIAEWWKQLFGESEGKDQRGIFPASVDLTTDLHSMGQYIQDGLSMKFETVLNIEKSRTTIILEAEENDLDGLNYIANKELDYVNKCAMQGTIAAHTEGGVPNLMVHIPEQNEFYLGELFYFFEFAVAISGYLNNINPFDQPGVEFYKKNMFKLLGKPGYEK